MKIPDEFVVPSDAFERQRFLLGAHVATARHGPRSGRRAVSIALAAATVLGVLLATPAFGIGGQVLDLIRGKPAPPEVQTSFAANDTLRAKLYAHAQAAGARLHDRFAPVVADQARGVAAIESADGPIYLWAAPTEDGRQCWLIQTGAEAATMRPYGVSSCDGTDAEGLIRPQALWTAERPSVEIVHARVYDDVITRVDVELERSPSVSLEVVSGHAIGTVPKDARVVAFVGKDADGGEVTRAPLP
jgi:hypothetical protein